MANPYINKVILGNEILIDISNDTVMANKLAYGFTAHDMSGASITGTAEIVYDPATEALSMPDWMVTING